MIRKICMGVLVLVALLIAIPRGHAMAAPSSPSVQGVWTCTIIRAGTVQRPIMYTFNADGTFNYSSATTINSTVPGPVQDSGFHSRGGARGQWSKISTNVVNYQSYEFLYDANGNLAGTFSVQANLLITSAGQLCSGRSECPNQNTAATLVKYDFGTPDGVDGNITGTQYLLTEAPVNVLCNTLNSGAGFPGLPQIPSP